MEPADRPPFRLNPPRPPRTDGRFDELSFVIHPAIPADGESYFFDQPHAVEFRVDGQPINALLNDENGPVPVSYFGGPSMAAYTCAGPQYGTPARVLLTCCGCGDDGCASTTARLRELEGRVVIDQLRSNAATSDEVFTFERGQFDETLRALWRAIEALPSVGDRVC